MKGKNLPLYPLCLRSSLCFFFFVLPLSIFTRISNIISSFSLVLNQMQSCTENKIITEESSRRARSHYQFLYISKKLLRDYEKDDSGKKREEKEPVFEGGCKFWLIGSSQLLPLCRISKVLRLFLLISASGYSLNFQTSFWVC